MKDKFEIFWNTLSIDTLSNYNRFIKNCEGRNSLNGAEIEKIADTNNIKYNLKKISKFSSADAFNGFLDYMYGMPLNEIKDFTQYLSEIADVTADKDAINSIFNIFKSYKTCNEPISDKKDVNDSLKSVLETLAYSANRTMDNDVVNEMAKTIVSWTSCPYHNLPFHEANKIASKLKTIVKAGNNKATAMAAKFLREYGTGTDAEAVAVKNIHFTAAGEKITSMISERDGYKETLEQLTARNRVDKKAVMLIRNAIRRVDNELQQTIKNDSDLQFKRWQDLWLFADELPALAKETDGNFLEQVLVLMGGPYKGKFVDPMSGVFGNNNLKSRESYETALKILKENSNEPEIGTKLLHAYANHPDESMWSLRDRIENPRVWGC